MKTVIIDNYDSFTYNLAHLVRELGAEVTVWRNDRFALQQLEVFDKIILSPVRGFLPRRACCLTPSDAMPTVNPSWVCAWGIRP